MALTPNLLYRFDLGWLAGHRLLQITHRGRKSGQLHRTVVEVVRYDSRSHESIVFAGWEGRTDWYRNIQAAPALAVRTGRTRYVPEQRFLTDDEAVRELASYARRHPWLTRYLLGSLLGLRIESAQDVPRAARSPSVHGIGCEPRIHAR
ncbi:MAG: nitroreductase family deazaflavin-dependent oxidoreductase [Chloroflexi bacterium]|nr:nitroreductase family deazaflavin-dependent oxidoreductase [Chloroflexota bacterium]